MDRSCQEAKNQRRVLRTTTMLPTSWPSWEHWTCVPWPNQKTLFCEQSKKGTRHRSWAREGNKLRNKQQVQKTPGTGLESTFPGLWRCPFIGALSVGAETSLRKEMLDGTRGCTIMKGHQSHSARILIISVSKSRSLHDLKLLYVKCRNRYKTYLSKAAGKILWDWANKTLSMMPSKWLLLSLEKSIPKSIFTHILTHSLGRSKGEGRKDIILKGKEFRIYQFITPNLFTASRNTETTGGNVAGEQVIQCQRISTQMISFNNNVIQLGNTQHQPGSVFTKNT